MFSRISHVGADRDIVQALDQWVAEGRNVNNREILRIIRDHGSRKRFSQALQKIFMEYRQAFTLTYMWISLMVVCLPLSFCKDCICKLVDKKWLKNIYGNNSISNSLGAQDVPLQFNERWHDSEGALQQYLMADTSLSETEAGQPLLLFKNEEDEFLLLEERLGLSSWEVIKYSLYLTPLWFITEYFSNSALAYTSVASTTVLTSTSGFFTLFFGAVIGKDFVNVTKIAAILISMAGVAMTTAGKTWATDEMLSTSEMRRHSITGGFFGLLSAVFYGLFIFYGLFTAQEICWIKRRQG